jgi:hypothetical protein
MTCMSTKMVQIRDVPVQTVNVLKARAAAKGMSLSEYLRVEVERMAAEPTMDEFLARLVARPRRVVTEDVADVVREVRDEFER